jgi:NADPH:quinone reductase-like Zn-dependent oxidoreductase
LSFAEAAVVPTAGFEGLHFVRAANLKPGDKVLIIGAGGSIGTFAIQLAKHFGGVVTGVDSTEKLEMIRSTGAEHVIDYTQEDYTKSTNEYDLIIDVVGKHSVARRLRLLKPEGVYFLAFARLYHIVLAWWTSLTSTRKLKLESASQTKEDLIFLKELIEAGKLIPIIDRQFPLEKTGDAHRYAESGDKKGNIAIVASENFMISPIHNPEQH